MVPEGIAATGFPAVEQTCKAIGVSFDPWQRELNRYILAKRSDGRYAAPQVALSIPRQVGKTWNVGALVFADSIINPGSTTVWTAQRFPVARETFDEMRALARSPLLARHIDSDDITTATGNECIPFRNGSRILFKARDSGVLRGFTKVRRLVLDEAQILTSQAMSDLAPTLTHGSNPQIIIMGTPPKPNDDGDVFRGIRDTALSGKSSGLLYVEFSADAHADPDDLEQLAKANPSFPHRTTPEKVALLRQLITDDEDYLREAFGIWSSTAQRGVIPMGVWSERADKGSAPAERMAIGIEVAPDLERASVSVAGLRADGTWHVSLVERRPGADWVARYVRALVDANPGAIRAVAVDEKSPSSLILDALRREGVRYMPPKPNELGQAHSRLLEGIVTGQVKHRDQPLMTIAASVAGKRNQADSGLWVFSRSSATADITPVQSAVLALWAAQHQRPKSPSGRAAQRKVIVYS